MPLPDERPRQSVANLIGRFEQQNKRQSFPSSLNPTPHRRLPSDSVKEAKDKKEASPRPVMAADAQPVFSSASPSAGEVKLPPSSPQTSQVAPDDVASGSSEPPKSPPPKDKLTAARKSTPTSVGTRIASSPRKSRPSTASHSSVKSSVKPAPSKSSLPSTSQPLKPQHTGQSVASNASLSRTPRPASKSVPLTPSRPKTPATQPRASTTRPKTPAGGLFAPTAASLARSRNTQIPVPLPVKQVTSGGNASERFTKPTAASLSKARTPVSVASTPTRVTKSTSTGAVPRSLIPKAVLSPAGAKDAKAQGAAKDKILPSSEPPASEPTQGGRAGEDTVLSNAHGSVDISQEGAHNDQVTEGSQEDPPAASKLPYPLSDDSSLQNPDPEQLQPVEDEGRDVQEEVCEKQWVAIVTAEPHEDDLPADPNGQHTDIPSAPFIGYEIEDTMNPLEDLSISKPRPQSMISIPDEHLDTSDEC